MISQNQITKYQEKEKKMLELLEQNTKEKMNKIKEQFSNQKEHYNLQIQWLKSNIDSKKKNIQKIQKKFTILSEKFINENIDDSFKLIYIINIISYLRKLQNNIQKDRKFQNNIQNSELVDKLNIIKKKLPSEEWISYINYDAKTLSLMDAIFFIRRNRYEIRKTMEIINKINLSLNKYNQEEARLLKEYEIDLKENYLYIKKIYEKKINEKIKNISNETFF